MTVGSRRRWTAAGSPPESTARRASSKTGPGGHHMSSSSFSLRCEVNFVEPSLRWRGSVLTTAFGEKGTRNLKHDLRSRATRGSTVKDWGLEPKSDKRSEGVASGVDGEDGAWRFEKKGVCGKDDDAVRDNEMKSANRKEREGLFILQSLPPPLTIAPLIFISISSSTNARATYFVIFRSSISPTLFDLSVFALLQLLQLRTKMILPLGLWIDYCRTSMFAWKVLLWYFVSMHSAVLYGL